MSAIGKFTVGFATKFTVNGAEPEKPCAEFIVSELPLSPIYVP